MFIIVLSCDISSFSTVSDVALSDNNVWKGWSDITPSFPLCLLNFVFQSCADELIEGYPLFERRSVSLNMQLTADPYVKAALEVLLGSRPIFSQVAR